MRIVPPRTILIVDDDPHFGALLAKALSRIVPDSVKLVVEKTPEAALERLAELDHVAIVVADQHLGTRMTGVELLRLTHERDPMHHRILMTGYRPYHMPEATYPIVMEAFEKPTWLDPSHPLLRAIAERCLPREPRPVPVRLDESPALERPGAGG